MTSRTQRSLVSDWWWGVDRWFLAAFLILLVGGLVLSFAASPPVAERIGLEPFHFVKRHAVFLLPSLAVMFACSLLTPRGVRRTALLMLGGSLFLMVLALFFGTEIKGARRWIELGPLNIQPSEFMKPTFVVICAWLFAEKERRPDIPGNMFAMILLLVAVALLVAQPDLGQTILIAAAWGGLFFMAGMSWFWIALLGGAALGGSTLAYFAFPHVASRIDRFLTGEGDTFQTDTAREAIMRGGWLGQGPGEGTVKRMLPDSHTDFAFAVIAEEFGIITCMALAAIFAFIVVRGLSVAGQQRDVFNRLAISGLVLLFGLQSIINMAVNLQLMPAKGMTLPFISYGGSSMLAIAMSAGFILALTRRRPENRSHTDRLVQRTYQLHGA
ncbi:MAG: putative lipid II flippase FtsW [Aurantimonas endophytica]|uniref:Probable peptidoglycan glycosyltransferase FtsW n=1 Tax=Aurantimonas endophytica TaxID=1522175 RepID=A0A7W6HC98_9HYPH|nr:putative lipid II flippase FtsW [Aurantimonas endophytica]MBB4002308.1 cell division protein FtsW [Aurantimonas endophytica]MCO6402068.1 putative lipid II flippase FtsW [Aurantimonas endophytica]